MLWLESVAWWSITSSAWAELSLAKTVRLLKERFHHDIVKIFGVEPGELSANETSYLVGFRSVDEIRNRLAKAEQEIDNRLRSKGVSRAVQGRAG